MFDAGIAVLRQSCRTAEMTRDKIVHGGDAASAHAAEGPSIAALETFLRAALSKPLPGPDVQRRFAPVPARDGWAPDLRPLTARHAAALILIHPGPDGP